MAKTITATVKFFNQKKGFGFMKRETGGDIFVHATVVEASGFDPKSMMPGVEATFDYEADGDKKQVTSISILGGLRPSQRIKKVRRQGKKKQARTDAKVDAFHVGRVKFFNEEKGFGFLKVIDEDGLNDLFVHILDIPSDLHPPQEGDVYDIVVHEKAGRLRALVLQAHEGEYANSFQKAA